MSASRALRAGGWISRNRNLRRGGQAAGIQFLARSAWPFISPNLLMQNFLAPYFSVFPAQAGIQQTLIQPVFIAWTPAFAGVTIRLASNCW